MLTATVASLALLAGRDSSGLRGSLESARKWVVSSDSLRPADLIFTLNGKSLRGREAGRLYRAGYAPFVVTAATLDTVFAPDVKRVVRRSQYTYSEIRRAGVPEDSVMIFHDGPGVRNTRDEARALVHYLDEHPEIERVIVVTSDYHTGRARRTIRQELGDRDVEVLIHGMPSESDEAGRKTVALEFIKQVGTILRLDNWIEFGGDGTPAAALNR